MDDKTLNTIQAIAEKIGADISDDKIKNSFGDIQIEEPDAQVTDNAEPAPKVEVENKTVNEVLNTDSDTSAAITTQVTDSPPENDSTDVLRPNVSIDEVADITRLSRKEQDKLKLQINQFDLRLILPEDRQRRGFICPFCGNGSGHKGDGIIPSKSSVADDYVLLYHCHSCGNFNGDLYKIIADLNNLDSRKDFCKILAIGKKIMAATPIKSELPPLPTKKELTDEQKSFVANQIEEFAANIDDLPVEDRRALSLDTLKHFHCGYCPNWKYPFSDKNIISRRIIIPTGPCHYNAILPSRDRTGADNERKSLNVNEKQVFNSDAIVPNQPVIVVEGEIDAMSIWQATKANVCATGGASSWDKLLPYLENIPADNRKDFSFVILFDYDKGGIPEGKKFNDVLSKLGFKSYVDFIHKSDKVKVDANDILIRYGDDDLKILVDKILDAAQIYFADNEIIPAAEEVQADEKRDWFKLSREALDAMIFEDNNNDGNAERFLKCYCGDGGVVQYVRNLEQWMVFSTPHWRLSQNKTTTVVIEPFLKMARQARKYAAAEIKTLKSQIPAVHSSTTSDEENKRVEKVQSRLNVLENFSVEMRKLGDRKYYNPAIKTAEGKAILHSKVTSDMLNNYPYLLNTPSGIVDLTTGKVYPHDPKYFITQCTNAEYRAGYRNETVEKFLRDILPDEETRNFLLDYSAYDLTGSVELEIALFIYGGGSNGKGTFTKTLQSALGTGINGYATALSNEVILRGAFPRDANAPSPEKAKLENKRLAVIEELPNNRKLDESEFKTLTGGDILSARLLHQNPRDIYPQFKLLISGNFLPSIDNVDDYALMRRINICPFTQTFKDNNVNRKLKLELATPAAQCGLLSLLVDRCVELYKRGFTLTPSAAMDAAKRNWLDSFKSNDCTDAALSLIVRSFLNNFCQHDPHGFILWKDFIAKFRQQNPNITISYKQENQIKEIILNHEDFKTSYGRSNKGMKIQGLFWS